MTTVAEVRSREAMGQTFPNVTAMDSATGSSDSSSTDAATISSNDFLTLLVTEMQNQDPTANTDPNEYINQLVNVNSLEQLISINQTLSTAMGTSATSDATGTSNAALPGGSNGGVIPTVGNASHPQAKVATGVSALHAAAPHTVSGNLGIPAASVSAERVADSLSGARNQISRVHSAL